MKAEKNKVVAVSYQLEVEGKIADQAGSEHPLEYIHGTGMLLPKFEEAVSGKEPGDCFDFVLAPEDGYGTYNPEYKVDIPKSAFEIDGKLRDDLLIVGNIIPMLNGEGQVIQGCVAAVSDKGVTMDFNHPMAGKTLHFTGKVETVRSASEKELTEGLHGEYLPKEECGCSHGGCNHGDCNHGDCGCNHGDCNHDECGHDECRHGDCGCNNK